ncbi:hypothetical protein BLNAU_12814 [Blattamonas nauphoetae]|uniref:Uncharacterized protein n=1 Tax=Blattamonas nauphoetae TaxID=2049346 RepID=A0ABQ9XQ69_9EUKA|nr:hypothetical protein BLNAU_12814 [Blattamonas nauphoetae]
MDSTSSIPKIGEILGYNVKNSVGLSLNGYLYFNTPSSNSYYDCHPFLKEGDCVRIEVDLDSTPRTMHLFVNGQALQCYMSGIPSSVRIGEMSTLQLELEVLQEDLSDMVSQKVFFEKKCLMLDNKMTELERELSDLRSRQTDNSHLRSLPGSIQVNRLEAEITNLREELRKLEEERNHWQEETNRIQFELEQDKEENQLLLEQHNETISELEEENKNLVKDCMLLKGELEQNRQQHDEMIHKVQLELETVTRRVKEEYENEMNRIIGSIQQEHEATLSKLQKELFESEEHQTQISSDNRILSLKLTQLEGIESDLEELRADRERLRRELTEHLNMKAENDMLVSHLEREGHENKKLASAMEEEMIRQSESFGKHENQNSQIVTKLREKVEKQRQAIISVRTLMKLSTSRKNEGGEESINRRTPKRPRMIDRTTKSGKRVNSDEDSDTEMDNFAADVIQWKEEQEKEKNETLHEAVGIAVELKGELENLRKKYDRVCLEKKRLERQVKQQPTILTPHPTPLHPLLTPQSAKTSKQWKEDTFPDKMESTWRTPGGGEMDDGERERAVTIMRRLQEEVVRLREGSEEEKRELEAQLSDEIAANEELKQEIGRLRRMFSTFVVSERGKGEDEQNQPSLHATPLPTPSRHSQKQTLDTARSELSSSTHQHTSPSLTLALMSLEDVRAGLRRAEERLGESERRRKEMEMEREEERREERKKGSQQIELQSTHDQLLKTHQDLLAELESTQNKMKELELEVNESEEGRRVLVVSLGEALVEKEEMERQKSAIENRMLVLENRLMEEERKREKEREMNERREKEGRWRDSNEMEVEECWKIVSRIGIWRENVELRDVVEWLVTREEGRMEEKEERGRDEGRRERRDRQNDQTPKPALDRTVSKHPLGNGRGRIIFNRGRCTDTARQHPGHVYVAKQHFQMQFAAQYTIEHAQSIEWHTVLIHDLNNDERVTLSEIDESMSLGDISRTKNTPDGRDLSSLLMIMTFSSTDLEDPQFRHSQPVSDFHGVRCDFYLNKALPRIARNVIVAIDSSIGPLSQSEFPNYNKRPDEIMPLDTSKFMLKTVESYWYQENLELPLKDILFRPSWFSLLSHILFNSQKYERKPICERLRAMAHVVTGSSGVGKSVLRFPAITLALSLGVKKVCTAKVGEYPLRFVRKTWVATPLSTAAPPAKKPTMRVAHVNKPPRDAPITPTTYKYEVFISKTKTDQVYNHTVFDDKSTTQQEVDPNKPAEVKSTQPKKENCIKLGEVEVPSIHHFPHFLRLFVDRCDQIHNLLEGKTWHIVDDLILSSDNLKRSQLYILLTTPNRASWKQVASIADQSLISLALYVLPKYTLAEEVNLLNALPCQSDQLDEYSIKRRKKRIKTDGFTPLSILPDLRQSPTLEERAKEVIASGDVIGQSIFHNLIVLDSPQADPHNFTTAYASTRAEEIVAEKWTTKLKVQHKFLDDPANRCSSAELTDLMIPSLFQRLTNSAVRQGAHFSRLKIRGQLVVREDGTPFSFPPTPTRSRVASSGTCDTLHAFLPDMAEFQCSEENRFDDDKWGRFFVHGMIAKPFKREPVEEKKGKVVFLPTGTPNPIEMGRITPNDSVTPSEEQIMDQHEQPHTQACSPAEIHFFTFHLVPHSLYNAGFESILLFFRVDSTNKIDSLGVHFLKSSIGDGEEIDEVGANAMMAWLVLLMDLYELRADQIFPHFVFVVSERVFDRFTPNTGNITSFIPEDNIVIAALTSQTGNLRDLTIEAEDTLLLDTGKRLLPNNDPMCVRCGFCGEVIGDEFFHHKCWYSRSGWTNLNFPRQLFDQKTRHSLFKREPDLSKKMVKLTIVVVSEDDPTFFYTQKTLAEREAGRQAGSSDRHADTHPVGLQVKYPFPTMARPNARMSGNHLTFDVVRVTMVSPVEAQRLGRRLLTDSFVDAEHATPLSMSVTVNLPHPLPPPCHIYRTPFSKSKLAPRAARMILPSEMSDPEVDEEAEKEVFLLFRRLLKKDFSFGDFGLKSTPHLQYFASSVREQEQADEQKSRHRHGHVEPTTSD